MYTYPIDSVVKVANELNSEGILAIEVNGITSKEKRDRAVRKFREKRLQILVNVNLSVEDADLPNIDRVIIARSTASLTLYLQFPMQYLDSRPGKAAIIIDHVSNLKKLGYLDDDRDWKQAARSREQKSRTLLRDPGLSAITCDYCSAVVKAGDVEDSKCPVYGKPVEVHEAKPVSDVNLVRATKAHRERIKKTIQDQIMTSVVDKSVGELKSVSELVAYSKLRGYEPDQVYFMTKKKGIFK